MGFNKDEEIEKQEEIDEIKKEVKKPASKKEEVHRWVVVKQEELPTQIVRKSVAEDGTILHFMSTEEALTELMNKEDK